jgi:hypothetical protein
MLQFLALPLSIRATSRWEHVDTSPVKRFFLKTELAFTLGKLFVDYFPVESHDVRRELLKLLRKHDTAFGEISSRQFFLGLGGPLDQVREADAEFDHALVVVIVKRFGHYATFIQDGPELIGATGVVMAHTHGRFGRIAADDDQLHTFSQMVGECSHIPSVAYFLFRGSEIQLRRSQWSRSLVGNRFERFEGEKKGPFGKARVADDAGKQENIKKFLAAEKRRIGEKERGLGSPSCV